MFLKTLAIKAVVASSATVCVGGAAALSMHHQHHPAPPPATAPTTTPGNIEVTVPPVPPQKALPGLCRAFLSNDVHGKSGTAFQVLVGATGGTFSKTDGWCQQYLLLQGHPQPANQGNGGSH